MKIRVCLKYFVNDCGFFIGWASFEYHKTSQISELLPSACPAPEIKILSVLVKFSWKAEIELSS